MLKKHILSKYSEQMDLSVVVNRVGSCDKTTFETSTYRK